MNEAEKWAAKVKEFRDSKQSQRVWSKEKGINRSTLRYWLERTDDLSEGGEVTFAKINRWSVRNSEEKFSLNPISDMMFVFHN